MSANLNELPDEQLDRIAAEEVMGGVPDKYVLRKDASFYATQYEGLSVWHPCTDRNQSRLVAEAARVSRMGMGPVLALEMKKVMPPGTTLDEAWHAATPRQEVIAAILAVREANNG